MTMIEAVYMVQNPHITPSAARGTVNGKEMVVTVDAFEVELVSQNSTHSGIKLRFLGEDVAAAQELFKVDTKVTCSFAAEAAPAEAAPGA
jgi:hypothetical protein